MLPTIHNLFADDSAAAGETFHELLTGGRFRLEQIVSRGEASPPGFWYDQPEQEWVALIRGSATLEFDGGEILELGEGDFLTIPASLRHRVSRVSEDAVWLALFGQG